MEKNMKFNNPDITYWFSSDFHGFHRNICKGVSRWNNKDGCRDFPDHIKMTNHIINQVNKRVMPDDVLFYLGDWTFGGIDNIYHLRKRLNVKTIYFASGNHDSHIKKNKHLSVCDKNAQELFTDVQPLYEIQVHGHRMTLCHYAMRTWYSHNKGSWNLHGHSHSSLPPIGKQLDVGIDEAFKRFGEYRPFEFKEIQKIMQQKQIHIPDHHD